MMVRNRWALLLGLTLALGCGRGGGSGDDDDDDDDVLGTSDVDPDPHSDGTSEPTDDTDGNGSQATGDTTSGEDTESEDPCGSVAVSLEQEPARVLMVLDKSGSMTILWDHDGNPATAKQMRWDSLVSVVDSITTRFNETIDFGAQLFPSADALSSLSPDACVVEEAPEVSVAPMNRDAVMAMVSPFTASTISGGTPTTAGMSSAIAHLLTLPAKEVPTSIVLITDGAANCDQTDDACTADVGSEECKHEMFEVYDEHLEPVVESARVDHGYNTYVVGIDIVDEFLNKPGNPQVNPHDALNDLAQAGGRPRNDPSERFYNARNEEQLQAALDEIAGQIRTCSIDLTKPPNHPPGAEQANFVKLRLAGMDVPYHRGATSCAGIDGWRWTNPEGPYTELELCGTWCDVLKIEAKVEGTYDCPPIN